MSAPTTYPGAGHQMILASAGSGKTYALTNRFVRLLALGVSPHRILALTFTRKAAAEFLDEILRKLSEAASDPKVALRLSNDLQIRDFDCALAVSLLRLLVSELHLLTLGTLDSFFNRILTCFPAEFGLSSGFEILEDHAAADARLRVFQQIFRDSSAHQAFLEAFKASTFGSEEKSLVTLLHDFIGNHHSLFLRASHREQWGDPEVIWGAQGCAWLESRPDVATGCQALAIALESLQMDKPAAKMWSGFLQELPSLQPGDRRPKAISETFLERIFEHYGQICAGGPVEVKFGRKEYVLNRTVCQHLNPLLDHFLACELRPHLRRTGGIYDLVHTFEARYHQMVRRAGKLGFEDVQLLLSGLLPGSENDGLLSLDGSDGRLSIDYRLDGQFDHWLLDEFQDTSLPQWKVIENLADEVIQDAEGRRSFFYVGDVKQAIFGWRGGDSHLFQDIYEYYRQPEGPLIAKETMELSWRSGPYLLNTLNRVFGDAALLSGLFPDHGEAVRRWEEDWRPHRSNHASRTDFFRLISLPKENPAGLSNQERRQQAVAALLEEIAPHEKDLSCAILVRANKSAHALADYLRAHTGIEVMVDGDTHIGRDHPLGSSFLALLQLAAHPGDSLAWKHLCMTPALSGEPSRQSQASRRELVRHVLELLHDRGFRAVFDLWIRLLESGGFRADALTRSRIELLRQACREFDQGGNRSIPEFLRFAEALCTRESQSKGMVQILTIHKSKGLGFDAVIVAEIESERDRALTDLHNTPLLVHERGRGLKREIDWVLSMPRKDVCGLDPVLQAARLRLENEKLHEDLCLLYVALTRAKFATYVIAGEPGAAATAPAILHRALGEGDDPGREWPCGEDLLRIPFEAGDPDWFAHENFCKKTESSRTGEEAYRVPNARPYPALPRSRPSSTAEEKEAAMSPGEFFAAGAVRAADFGTRVHALFERIEWLDSLPAPSLPGFLEDAIDPGSALDQDALEVVRRAIQEPGIAAVFQRSAFGDAARVWRERNFEMVLAGSWVSGTFDRVVLTPARAWIYDFKTNRVTSAEDIEAACQRYAPQLATYRAALSKLVQLPLSAISSHLIFTHPRVVREV